VLDFRKISITITLPKKGHPVRPRLTAVQKATLVWSSPRGDTDHVEFLASDEFVYK
jgi:hypothetical protein